ncbi:DUF58 domain-containing protein [Psychromicrobium xiongbiense]|uniref:DUF58 domain-containing protein n=1 Tax=Psychromicrobium xiongbiense TaxID=3051184 RepID=UPI002554A7EA|nr:DUF58 domain-containing protein [Psychromicrobium sp. YIM S02556]
MVITGRFVLLAAAGALALLLAPSWTTVWILCAVLVLPLVVDALLAASPRKLRFARQLPGSIRLSQSCTAELFVANKGRRTVRGSLRDAWQPSAGATPGLLRLSVPRGERRRLNLSLTPTRRGDLHSQTITVRSLGPLGLAGRQRTAVVPGRLRVLPEFRARKHLASKLRKLRELEGLSAVQIRGAGTEFDSLRDYVRGDDVRSIDWRATARRQAVVVRTWRPERDRRVVIVADTSRTSAARILDEPRLDSYLEAALLLGVLADRGGDRVSFLAFDRRPRAQVTSAQKTNLLGAMVQAMAPLTSELIEMDWTQVPSQVRQMTAHRALVVLLTSLDSGALEEGLLPVVARLSRDHVVVVASVSDPALEAMRAQRKNSTEVYAAAAAERSVLDRAAVIALLKQAGAEVVEAEPQELPPRLADLYLRLKAAGRL